MLSWLGRAAGSLGPDGAKRDDQQTMHLDLETMSGPQGFVRQYGMWCHGEGEEGKNRIQSHALRGLDCLVVLLSLCQDNR